MCSTTHGAKPPKAAKVLALSRWFDMANFEISCKNQQIIKINSTLSMQLEDNGVENFEGNNILGS